MRKQNRLFNVLIAIFAVLTLLFLSLGCIKNFNKTQINIEEKPTVSVTPVEMPIVTDKEEKWYLHIVKKPVEYYAFFDYDSSLRGRLADCVKIIYQGFDVNFSKDNFEEELFGTMSDQYIGPTQLINAMLDYNKNNNVMDIKVSDLVIDGNNNFIALREIVNNNYPVIVWYSVKSLDENEYFDSYAYWDYAKPLIVYSIDDTVHVIDPETGYETIDKDVFETTWIKCGNRAIVIG